MISGLDMPGFHKLYDYEKADETQNKEERKIYPLVQEHEECNDGKPESEGDNGNLFLSHYDSCCEYNGCDTVTRVLVLQTRRAYLFILRRNCFGQYPAGRTGEKEINCG
jgi:hypothetical protein